MPDIKRLVVVRRCYAVGSSLFNPIFYRVPAAVDVISVDEYVLLGIWCRIKADVSD